MKKFIILLSILFLSGCSINYNTPVKQVELFMNKYQSMDTVVLNELNNIVNNDKTLSKDNKKEYCGLMEKQYQNLSYKIKSEDIHGDNATVKAEIEVYDYNRSILKSLDYYNNNQEEFKDINSFNNYKLKQLKNVTDRVKYDIIFYLEMDNNENWFIHDLNDNDIKKIHGLFSE